MKKKLAPAARPQAAQIQAIERCLERGDIEEAHQRLLRLQTAFPDFKPLKRLAFEIALESGRAADGAAAAWDWCEASPNSAAALNALFEVSRGYYPYLFHHAGARLLALGEPVPDEVQEVRQLFGAGFDEREGLRLDLSQVFMGAGRIAEARPLVETSDLPAGRNNFAQILFAEGDVRRAAEVFESVLAKDSGDHFALYRLATLRLWLSGETAAADLNGRLQAIAPTHLDELRHQMESALLFDQVARADEIYRSAPDLSWYDQDSEYNPESADAIHYLGAMAAWRLGNYPEAIQRLRMIGEDNDKYGDISDQCFLAGVNGDTPDWALGDLSQWWPMHRIMSFKLEKFKNDDDLFEIWQVPMPHFDYLVAVALSGGSEARTLALAALSHLADKGGELRQQARQAMLRLLRLPCGPDSFRSRLHAMMADGKLIDSDTTVDLFFRGKVTETRPLAITIREDAMEQEKVLGAADHKRYERAVNLVAGDKVPQALEIMEDLLSRYPDYPRILTAAASLRENSGEPHERWAPLIRRAAEIAPDYFFSRVSMARLLALEKRIEEARESLKPLLELKEMHRTEWRSLIGAQITIAQAEGDFPAIARLEKVLWDYDRSRE